MDITRRAAALGLASGAMSTLLPISVLAATARTAPANGSIPKVTGPISGGAKGWPFGADPGDLPSYDYIEEEYFIEGVANRYKPVGELRSDGNWAVEPADTAPYKTRILIRRPRDPAKFNGTVLVEWANVSSGYDITFGDQPGVYKDGFVHAAVSAQRVGVHGFSESPKGLVQWDPERYGTLSIPGDSLSFDIFSQGARVLAAGRRKGVGDPLRGLKVRKLIAIGGSQSAARLNTYINAIQPRDRIFDALMPTVSAGAGVGFEDFVLNPADMGSFARHRIPTRLRDVSVPVMVVNSESETLSFYPARQPDGRRFRFWEVAGSSHAPAQSPLNWPEQQSFYRKVRRDGIPPYSSSPTASRVLWRPCYDAAILHLNNWINGGSPPPIQPVIAVAGATPAIVRDQYGNAKGGVRLPDVEVPIAANHGSGEGAAWLAGLNVPFTPEVLRSLYPTHDDYVGKVVAAAEAAQRAGVILPYRVAQYRAEAEIAKI
ncbi:MAG TPA: alpha/beta hydrolase domain-containing protein [Novosphingobium sp.]|nr:alpha/beta hydrolase domain-containing protein [Novosphingobium sp.]